jgi:hypothetical protein
MRDLPVLKLNLNEPELFGNVAEKLDVQERRTLAIDLIELVKIDETSMGPWLTKAKGYLEKVQEEADDAANSGEQQGNDEEPPPKTDMVLSAVIQFAAGATDALLGEPDLARASEPGGEALASWVSSQLRTQDPNWTLDTDPLVIHMSVTGLGWRKRDFDDADRVFHSHFLPCTDVIINANTKSVERAPRIAHDFERYPYEIDRSISRKKWIDYEPRNDDADPQAPHKFYEVDLWLDLDGDEIDEPWTVTLSRDDMAEVVRIRPRWSRKTVVNTDEALFFNPIRRFYPYRLLPSADGSFLPMGFGRILDRAQSSADNLLGSITDTAKSEAENGGVFGGGSGFGVPDSIELKNNRITVIPTDGAPLAGRFQAFPVKNVSPGSVQILDKILTLADRLSGTLNLMQNAPASMTATLAKGIIDTGTKVQSAVHRRLVQSMTQEFREFVQMADAYDMLPEGVSKSDGGGVAVTADPQLATEMQRSGLAGVYMEMMKQAAEGIPWNMQKLQLRLTQVLRLPNPEELIGQPKTAEATPDEKMKGALGIMKQKTEDLKAKAAVAVQITQALKNLVDAGGGMIDQRAALLQMAQLETVVQQLTQSAGNDPTGVAQQPGNPNAAGGAPQPQPQDAPAIPGGAPGGPGDAGTGGGVP